MTILSRIRARIGLLVGIIFVALMAFVLGDISRSGFFSGNSDNNIGIINGHSVSIAEFQNKMTEYSQGKDLNEQQKNQLSEAVWQEFLDKYIYEPEYNEIGVNITTKELAEEMMGDHPSQYMNQWFQDQQTGKVYQQFANPDGSLNGKAIREFVSKMTPEQEEQWAQIEHDMLKSLRRQKYFTILQKGFFVTTSEAHHEYNDENTKYSFKFFAKPYSSLSDSLVKVTDDELKTYYNNHLYKYKQAENMRSIEYVAFNILPSADDIAAERKQMEDRVPVFRSEKGKDDSEYVATMNESGKYLEKTLRAGQFPVGADSAFFQANDGDVLGPFNTGENFSIYKVMKHIVAPDSARVRHILIAYKGAAQAGPEITRTKEQAKAKADSLLKVIKSGKVKMEDIVTRFTDDPGSKHAAPGKPGYQGDYGWFTQESQFVQEFKDAGFNNPKGATVVVETAFGFHVIQVIDKTSDVAQVQVEEIDQKLEPSESTIRDVFNKASEFAGRNNTGALFTDAVQKQGMNLLKADNITENQKYISGIDNPSEIIRWMYDDNSKVGSVSQPFQAGDRYIVCRLSKVLDKGYKPFEEVRQMCELDVKKEKKGQMFSDELNKVKAPSFDAWAAAAKLTPENATGITFAAPYVKGAGYEGNVVGALSSAKPGQVIGPVIGSSGVYVVELDSVSQAPPLKDVKGEQERLISGYSSRVQATVSDILKDQANVVDERAKHF